MASWSTLGYAFAPLVAFSVVGVLVLLLRWAFGHGTSLVARPARRGHADEYGLLVPVAAPADAAAGEATARRLAEHGLRVTLAQTYEGPRVLVFPDDLERARRLLEGPGPHGSR